MTTPNRPALIVTCALGLVRSVLGATTPIVPTLPAWSVSGAVETAFGYNDNLLLSHTSEERSAFARGRAEVFIFNAGAKGPVEVASLGEVTGTRYFSGETVNHEAAAWLSAEPSVRVGDHWKFSLPVTGYYRDEVLDVSDTDVERLVAAWKVWGGSVSPTVRWNVHPAWWLEASATGDRRRYDDHANDSRVQTAELRLNWRLATRIETRLIGRERWRKFDSRRQYNAAGREITDSHLKIAEHEGELRVDITWDRAAHWQSSTRANLLTYRDNGSGFFDYREKGVSHEVEWKTPQWLARVRGSASRLDFDVQTVGFGLAPPPLLKDHFTAEWRLERVLSSRWTVFGGYTWERRRSNERFESYAVNEGLLGLRWSWEKP